MRVVPFVFLLFSVAFCHMRSCNSCDSNCRNKYSNESLADACIQGCHVSTGPLARTDNYNVNVECEQSCKDFPNDELKSACYGGCTYIPMLPVEHKSNGFFHFPLLSRILGLITGRFNSADEAPDTPPAVDNDQPIVRETHIRIFFPDSPSDVQNMMDDENMNMMMNIMHGSDPDDPQNSLRFIKIAPSPDTPLGASSFGRNFCFRARAALHHLATHPLFMASISLMFICSVILLILACIRLTTRRARRAAFQRQYRKIPGFFKSPSMFVSLTTPQPPQSDDDEAPILPTKEPEV